MSCSESGEAGVGIGKEGLRSVELGDPSVVEEEDLYKERKLIRREKKYTDGSFNSQDRSR